MYIMNDYENADIAESATETEIERNKESFTG